MYLRLKKRGIIFILVTDNFSGISKFLNALIIINGLLKMQTKMYFELNNSPL